MDLFTLFSKSSFSIFYSTITFIGTACFSTYLAQFLRQNYQCMVWPGYLMINQLVAESGFEQRGRDWPKVTQLASMPNGNQYPSLPIPSPAP